MHAYDITQSMRQTEVIVTLPPIADICALFSIGSQVQVDISMSVLGLKQISSQTLASDSTFGSTLFTPLDGASDSPYPNLCAFMCRADTVCSHLGGFPNGDVGRIFPKEQTSASTKEPFPISFYFRQLQQGFHLLPREAGDVLYGIGLLKCRPSISENAPLAKVQSVLLLDFEIESPNFGRLKEVEEFEEQWVDISNLPYPTLYARLLIESEEPDKI